MLINPNTRISALLKFHPGALEAITAIHPAFAKLKNPLARKLMAGRTSIAMAAKIAGCGVEDFYRQLAPLGYEQDNRDDLQTTGIAGGDQLLQSLQSAAAIELDVRPMLAEGQDPLKLIIAQASLLEPQQVLRIINSFEPVPLISLMKSKGFGAMTAQQGPALYTTYFFREQLPSMDKPESDHGRLSWNDMMEKFRYNRKELDVRMLSMPTPMHAILDALKELAPGTALFVHHHRVPIFLLTELRAQGYQCLVQEAPGDIQLLIFKDE